MEDDRGMTFLLPGLQQTEGRFAEVEIKVADDPGALSRVAAWEILSRATASIAEQGRFSLCLSGGSTPQSLYCLLAKDSFFRTHIPWNKTDLFWGDERHVPPDHPDSNYRMAKETLLSKVPIPENNIHRIKGENPDPHQAAREYQEVLLHFFRLGKGTFPRFDWCFSEWERMDTRPPCFQGQRPFRNRGVLSWQTGSKGLGLIGSH